MVRGDRRRREGEGQAVDAGRSLGFAEDLARDYRVACEASNEIVEALGDADAPVTRNGKTHNLRWAMLSVIGEVAQHTGHADIIREQIDGKTGR